jgi:hypothetical protein
MDIEIIGDCARDMALEYQRQGDTGNDKRDHDRNQAASDKPQS